jgi:hypothetical protein
MSKKRQPGRQEQKQEHEIGKHGIVRMAMVQLATPPLSFFSPFFATRVSFPRAAIIL